MSDALSLLRQFITNKKEFYEEDDKIIFGDVYYPKDVKTNYLIYGKTGDTKEYYTLECLVFLIKNVELQHSIYIKNASAKKISVVSRPDRKELLSYLNGETQTCSSIDKNAPLEITMQRPQPLTKQIKMKQDQFLVPQDPLQKINAAINSNATGSIDKYQHEQQIQQIQQQRKHKLDDENSAMKTFKEHIKKKIQNNITNPSITGNVNDLSEELTAEKITSLKAKFLAKKRKTIIGADNDDELVRGIIPNDAGDANDLTTRETFSRERVWRNRVTIMQSNGKTFDKNIFAILQSAKLKDDGIIQVGDNVSEILTQIQQPQLLATISSSIIAPSSTTSSVSFVNNLSTQQIQQNQNSKSRSLGYNRFDQERYGPKDETGGFIIDTKRTYQTNGAISLTETNANVSGKSPMVNVMNMNQGNVTPSPIANRIPTVTTAATTTTAITTTTTQQSSSSSSSSSSKRLLQKPIIIVPASRNAIITLFNCVDILQDLKYVSSEEKRKTLQNAHKESEIIMHRKEDGKTIQFKVIDNVSKLNREDWDRVVAVFAQGPLWQFKEWPWDGNPSEIFQRVKAFHLKWWGANLDSNIGKWSVTVIELDEHKRHLDRARLLVFWDELIKFMSKTRPHFCT